MKLKKEKLSTNDLVIPDLIKSIGENPEQYGEEEELEE
jgi:hypothetical protein